MKYHILGISTCHGATFPSIYCRYLSEEDVKQYGPECFCTFTGTLPDPSALDLEAITFDNLEAVQAHIAAEIEAGSTWTYALWPAEPFPAP